MSGVLNRDHFSVRRLMAGAVVILGLTSACRGEAASLSRDNNGNLVESGLIDAFEVRVGDCISLPEEPSATEFDAGPCSDPHYQQVYALYELKNPLGIPYPLPREIIDEAARGCAGRWKEGIGTELEPGANSDDSGLTIKLLYPTTESWVEDDRSVACLVINSDNSTMTGSVLAGSDRGVDGGVITDSSPSTAESDPSSSTDSTTPSPTGSITDTSLSVDVNPN